MQLSTAIILTLSASHLSNALLRRDHAQNSVSAPPSKLLISRQNNVPPLPQNEVCLYLTNDLNWGGDGQNLCGQTGICSKLHNLQQKDFSLTHVFVALADPSISAPLSLNVASAGPSPNQTCFLYDGENCTGDASAPIVYPGHPELHNSIAFDGSKVQSWRC
jgi:hypothetical protein